MPIDEQCNGKEAELVKYIYATKLFRVSLDTVLIDYRNKLLKLKAND